VLLLFMAAGAEASARVVHCPSTVQEEEDIIRLEEAEAVAVAVESSSSYLPSWQFWVFDVIPVLLAIGISVVVFFLAQQREVAQARDDFESTAWIIQSNVHLTLQKALENSRLLMGTVLANTDADDFPSAFVFEQMVGCAV
jgi:phage gp36-like protein